MLLVCEFNRAIFYKNRKLVEKSKCKKLAKTGQLIKADQKNIKFLVY